jgi:hypothetical protein
MTIMQKEGTKPRICIDARKINSITAPDREGTQPLSEELLHLSHGARYMTNLEYRLHFYKSH